MRKSRYVTILLAASSLVACDQSDKTAETIYGSIEACAKEIDVQSCRENYTAAKEQHAQTAPKFQTAEECKVAGFEPCEEVKRTEATASHAGGGGFFMPMMMGYMMGRTLGGGGTGLMGAGARPVYADRSGVLRTNPNTAVGKVAPGATSIGTVRTTARSGFGNVSRGTAGS